MGLRNPHQLSSAIVPAACRDLFLGAAHLNFEFQRLSAETLLFIVKIFVIQMSLPSRATELGTTTRVVLNPLVCVIRSRFIINYKIRER